MSRSKKSIYKTLLTKDLIYIHNKGLCMTAIKEGNWTLVGLETKGYWYSPTGSEWTFW